MGIFLRFILPSLFRRCLDHRVGPHSPRLHLCREPISHLTSVGGNHPCMSVAAQPVSLWETTPHRPPYDARIMPTAAVHRYQLGLYPSEVPLGSGDFLVLGRPVEPFGAKEWNRTTDLPLMRRAFLPTELLGHMYAPYVSIAATIEVDFSYACPSSRRLTNESNTKERKEGYCQERKVAVGCQPHILGLEYLYW